MGETLAERTPCRAPNRKHRATCDDWRESNMGSQTANTLDIYGSRFGGSSSIRGLRTGTGY